MFKIHLAGIYRRRVEASLERIWENVFDWQHLPALHADSFAAVELIDADAAGWRIRLTPQSGAASAPQVLHLVADREQLCYIVTTEAGPGSASEIRVALTPYGPHVTGIIVEYHVPVADRQRRGAIGDGFVAAYKTLWDEDEAMMHVREAALAPASSMPLPDFVELGALTDLVLPRAFAFGPKRFRLIDLNGRLVAHSVSCLHWLGPLDQTVVDNGRIRCPWHGYCFDVVTGRSSDGHGLRLAAAPKITVQNGNIVAHRV